MSSLAAEASAEYFSRSSFGLGGEVRAIRGVFALIRGFLVHLQRFSVLQLSLTLASTRQYIIGVVEGGGLASGTIIRYAPKKEKSDLSLFCSKHTCFEEDI